MGWMKKEERYQSLHRFFCHVPRHGWVNMELQIYHIRKRFIFNECKLYLINFTLSNADPCHPSPASFDFNVLTLRSILFKYATVCHSDNGHGQTFPPCPFRHLIVDTIISTKSQIGSKQDHHHHQADCDHFYTAKADSNQRL